MSTKKNIPSEVGRTGIVPTLGYRKVRKKYGSTICAEDSSGIRYYAPRYGAATDRRRGAKRDAHGLQKANGTVADERHDSGGVYGREQEKKNGGLGFRFTIRQFTIYDLQGGISHPERSEGSVTWP